MYFLTAHLFFQLESFAHASLWEEGDPVWAALHKLKDYLVSLPLGMIHSPIPEGVHLLRPELISVGLRTKIEPGVLIQGPCIIGDDCDIRHGAYIRDRVILGNHCHIGHGAEVKASILLDGAAATHFVYVGDSIIGNRVNLGAGTKCANLRLDREEITIQWEERRINSGLRKLGTVIGDRTQIGCNCVVNPGTLIGKDSVCHPLLNLRGYIPPNSHLGTNHKVESAHV